MLSHSVVSDSLRPHGLQPSRLLCPWGFSRQEYWGGLPYCPPGDLPSPVLEPYLFCLSCIGRQVLYHQGLLGVHGVAKESDMTQQLNNTTKRFQLSLLHFLGINLIKYYNFTESYPILFMPLLFFIALAFTFRKMFNDSNHSRHHLSQFNVKFSTLHL